MKESVMPNIKKIVLNSKTITGYQIRIKNEDEMAVGRGKIAPLWAKFYNEIVPTLKENAMVYGVYHNYESDARAEFDVLVGADVLELGKEMQSVSLVEGHYLMFPVKGELPHAIMDTWAKVWAYFEDESIDERRSYETDFEKYVSKDEVEIYIGVNYL